MSSGSLGIWELLISFSQSPQGPYLCLAQEFSEMDEGVVGKSGQRE